MKFTRINIYRVTYWLCDKDGNSTDLRGLDVSANSGERAIEQVKDIARKQHKIPKARIAVEECKKIGVITTEDNRHER